MLLLLITGFVIFGLVALYSDNAYAASRDVKESAILCLFTGILYGMSVLCLGAFVAFIITGAY